MKKGMIPHFVAVTAFAIFIALGLASATVEKPEGQKAAASDERVIGSVSATFVTPQGYAGANPEIDQAAYVALLDVARKEYQGNIDIRNVRWSKGKHVSGIPRTAIWAEYEFTATGNVVSLGGVSASRVEGALDSAAKEVSESFPAKARIAIVYITAEDRSTTEYIIGELEHILRRQGFFIVDRAELDKVRAEQKFGMSPEVDEATAAKIGHFAGASIVITGRVDGEGTLRRLRLRALHTETGQVVGTASQRL